MLARFVNHLWSANSGRSPGNPIKNLADEMVGEDTYSRLANYLTHTKPQPQDYPSQDPTQQLFIAVNKGDLAGVKELIETKKLPVDSVLSYGTGWPRDIKTPLLEAVYENHWDIARYLVDQGADVNFQERNDYHTQGSISPLMLVAFELKDHKERAEPLFKYMVEEKNGDLNRVDSDGNTLIHYAICQNDQMLFDYCLQHNAIIGVTPRGLSGCSNTALDEAARYNRLSMAKELLKRGANVDGEAQPGHSSPLSRAAVQRESRVEMMKLLISHEADVNFSGLYGITPLQDAVQSRRLDHARLLLENGADWKQRDQSGVSAESELINIAKFNAGNPPHPMNPKTREEYPVAEMQALFSEFKEKRLAELTASESLSSSDDENHAPTTRYKC